MVSAAAPFSTLSIGQMMYACCVTCSLLTSALYRKTGETGWHTPFYCQCSTIASIDSAFIPD